MLSKSDKYMSYIIHGRKATSLEYSIIHLSKARVYNNTSLCNIEYQYYIAELLTEGAEIFVIVRKM